MRRDPSDFEGRPDLELRVEQLEILVIRARETADSEGKLRVPRSAVEESTADKLLRDLRRERGRWMRCDF